MFQKYQQLLKPTDAVQLRPKTRGFSLIELLVVCALISVLGVALYNTFFNGVQLWKRAQTDRGELRDVFFSDRLTQDLRNATLLQNKLISGSPNSFEFFSLMTGSELGMTGDSVDLLFPCKVRYYLDQATENVIREVYTYSQVLNGTNKPYKIQRAFEGAHKMELAFMGRNKKLGVLWQRTWNKSYLPTALKLTFSYPDVRQGFSRIIAIPGGGQPERLPASV